jgi:hypothetical protein
MENMAEKFRHRFLTKSSLFIVLLLLSGCLAFLQAPLVARADDGTGTITVSGNAPSVTSIQIDTSPSSAANRTAVDVYTWYLVKIAVSDPDTLADIQSVTVRLYKAGVAWSDSMDEERRQGAMWTYGGSWMYLFAAGWDVTDNNYLAAAGSVAPSPLTETAGTWTFQFRWRSLSHYTTGGGWRIEARVVDKSSNLAWRTNVIDVNLLLSIVIPTSISWTATAGQANVTAAGMPFVIQYASNAIVKIQVKATNPTNSFGDTFSASNILIDDDANPATDTHTQKLTSAFVDWYPGLGVNYIGGTTINAYWFVTVPAGQPTGTYTFTYSVQFVFQDYAT